MNLNSVIQRNDRCNISLTGIVYQVTTTLEPPSSICLPCQAQEKKVCLRSIFIIFCHPFFIMHASFLTLLRSHPFVFICSIIAANFPVCIVLLAYYFRCAVLCCSVYISRSTTNRILMNLPL